MKIPFLHREAKYEKFSSFLKTEFVPTSSTIHVLCEPHMKYMSPRNSKKATTY